MVPLKNRKGYLLIGLVTLICLFGIASSSSTSKCSSNDDCSSGVCGDDEYCTPNGLFSSFSLNDICATVAILIGPIVAAGGGLGGGVFVPIFILILGLETKSAAALSQATIFGGSIVNLIMNFREHHPLYYVNIDHYQI